VGLVGIALYASESYLAAHPYDGTLKGHGVILFDESLRGMPGAAWLETQIAGAPVVMRSNEIIPLVAAVRGGAGIGYLPAIAAYGEPVVPLQPGLIGQPEIFLITHRDLRGRARVRATYDFIVRLCTERAADLAGTAITAQHGDRVLRELTQPPAFPPTPEDLSEALPQS